MKKFVCAILLCTLCLVSCGGNTDMTNYKTDVSVDDLSSKIYETVGNSSLIEADSGWVALNVPIDISLCEDAAVYISSTGSSDLFGIFKATSEENAETLLDQADEYLTTMEENWMSEYLPEELPKVRNAVTKKCGLYVTFLILEDDARDSASTEFESMLKK